MVKVNLNLDEIKDKFLEKIYNLLPKAKVRLHKDKFLSIYIAMPEEKITELRDEFLDLNEGGVSVRIKFGVTKIQIKNDDGDYEPFDLEEEFMIDQILSGNNFQVNRKIEWTEPNGIKRDAIVNNIIISIAMEEYNIEKKTIIKIERQIET